MKKLIAIIFLITLILLIVFSARPASRIPAHASDSETVVLLHGLARSSHAMNRMGKELKAAGFEVINHNYPSTSAPIEVLTTNLFNELKPRIADRHTVHFVTHSLGGIILRQHLEHNTITNLGRVVMLAPPSRGSEVPDKLGHLEPFQWINGPAGNQLGTGTNSHPLRLKAPDFELGIIAGDRTINPILSLLIPGPDDGKVSLNRVKPKVYTDYFQLHATHTFIMRNRTAIEQTIHFLEYGYFLKPESVTTQQSALYKCLYAQRGTHPMRLGGIQ
jgi:hypothetical protein